MRVISGDLGGRRLIAPDTNGTRPVTDRVKESVFSSISHLMSDSQVLDLFAGAGSFGIEAMSRGAARAVFVEKGRKALDALRRNLDTLGLKAEVYPVDVLTFDPNPHGLFDLVFCDPPWPMSGEILAGVIESLHPASTDDVTVVITRRVSDPVPRPSGFRIDDERSFGDTRIIRYEKEMT